MCDEPRNQKKIDETVIRMDEKRKTADKCQSKELWSSELLCREWTAWQQERRPKQTWKQKFNLKQQQQQ